MENIEVSVRRAGGGWANEPTEQDRKRMYRLYRDGCDFGKIWRGDWFCAISEEIECESDEDEPVEWVVELLTDEEEAVRNMRGVSMSERDIARDLRENRVLLFWTAEEFRDQWEPRDLDATEEEQREEFARDWAALQESEVGGVPVRVDFID